MKRIIEVWLRRRKSKQFLEWNEYVKIRDGRELIGFISRTTIEDIKE